MTPPYPPLLIFSWVLCSLIMVYYGKTYVNIFFSSNNIFCTCFFPAWLSSQSLCIFAPTCTQQLHLQEHTQFFFVEDGAARKLFFILFMSVIAQSSAPSFPKMHSKFKAQPWTAWSCKNSFSDVKICSFMWSSMQRLESESVVWGIAPSPSVCQL